VSVRVRTASKADVPAVIEVWEESRTSLPRTPDDPAVVERLLDHDPGALLVAEEAGVLVGVLIAGWDGFRGNVYRLAVRPSHRRLGIAQQLVEAGHDRLRELGARRVTALVGDEEGAAVSLWRAVGYRRDEFVHRFVRDL
jgi:ribosomal protein S18 acetylase RimI-like enzyme